MKPQIQTAHVISNTTSLHGKVSGSSLKLNSHEFFDIHSPISHFWIFPTLSCKIIDGVSDPDISKSAHGFVVQIQTFHDTIDKFGTQFSIKCILAN